MADDGVLEGGPAPSQRRLGRLERLPLRRIILTVLTIAIVAFVAGGSFKTLTLQGADHLAWSFWAQLLVIGVALGSVYALIALGYTLVYGVLRMINFAHGEVFMSGAFVSYFFANAYKDSGFLDRHPIPAILVLLMSAVTTSVLIAVLLERIAYRRLRDAPRLVPLITAIGASLFLQNTFQGLFGAQTVRVSPAEGARRLHQHRQRELRQDGAGGHRGGRGSRWWGCSGSSPGPGRARRCAPSPRTRRSRA